MLSGYQLPKLAQKQKKHNIIDPYVLVQVFGVPADCASEKTEFVKDEGLHPVWNREFKFTLRVPELAVFPILRSRPPGSSRAGLSCGLLLSQSQKHQSRSANRSALQTGRFQGSIFKTLCEHSNFTWNWNSARLVCFWRAFRSFWSSWESIANRKCERTH